MAFVIWVLSFVLDTMRMVFREGRTKAVGSVTKIFPHIPISEQFGRHSRGTKKHQDASHSTGRPISLPSLAKE